jgi:hypothetical protein
MAYSKWETGRRLGNRLLGCSVLTKRMTKCCAAVGGVDIRAGEEIRQVRVVNGQKSRGSSSWGMVVRIKSDIGCGVGR